MSAAPRNFRLPAHGVYAAAILLLGLIVALVSYRLGRDEERADAIEAFGYRASLHHALIREVLGHYEDALFGLAAVFITDDEVTLPEFTRVAGRLGERIRGVQALQWVPWVNEAERRATEDLLRKSYGRPVAGFSERTPDGGLRLASRRDVHFPVLWVHPLAGNEAALGYDLASGPTRSFLEQARTSGRIVVSHPVRLVQETGDQPGVVMICPVFRVGPTGPGRVPENFAGFLQCVFRAGDLLAAAYPPGADAEVEALFIDASEPDAARRRLHLQVNEAATAGAVGEAEFRAGLHRELALPFGGRDWRVIFRPRAGWVEAQGTATPLLRSGSLLLLAGLLAGLVRLIGRRTETIRHEVEQRTAELAESRRHFASLLQAVPGMAYRCRYDEQMTVLFVSEGAQALTGWSADEFMRGEVHFRDSIHPDDLARVREATRAALQDKSPVEVEYRIRTRSGEEKWVLSRGRGVYEADGNLRFFEGLAIDITAQKQAEHGRLELERKLLEGQKLESLGLLAGGIAHDFNNLLSSVLGNASLARLTLGVSSESEPQLRAIESAALRAAELCRQMLAYAGKGRFVVEPTDLSALVDELMPLLKISIGHQASLRLHLARPLPPVLADPTQVRQIVMNLVLNAADAMGDRSGEIAITTSVVRADAALLARCAAGADLPPGEYVAVEVRDTGCGMSPEVLAKIFDPFFTTKFAGRGLGLAAVLGIVRGHRGALRVESALGAGSSFQLLLPPAEVPAAGQGKGSAPDAPDRWRSSARVMIVEDEEPVRAVTAEMLKTFGVVPHPFADGPAAVEFFRQDPGGIDLVLLDLLMPGMSGEQTLAELRRINPDVRVLLMSGYSEGDILGRLSSGRGALGFVAKPFTRSILERSLRQMLES